MENFELKLPEYILENKLIKEDYQDIIKSVYIECLEKHLPSFDMEDIKGDDLKYVILKYVIENIYFTFHDINISKLLKNVRMELGLSSHNSVAVSYDSLDKKFIFCKQHIGSTYSNTIEEESIYSNTEMEKTWIIGTLILFNMVQ